MMDTDYSTGKTVPDFSQGSPQLFITQDAMCWPLIEFWDWSLNTLFSAPGNKDENLTRSIQGKKIT